MTYRISERHPLQGSKMIFLCLWKHWGLRDPSKSHDFQETSDRAIPCAFKEISCGDISEKYSGQTRIKVQQSNEQVSKEISKSLWVMQLLCPKQNFSICKLVQPFLMALFYLNGCIARAAVLWMQGGVLISSPKYGYGVQEVISHNPLHPSSLHRKAVAPMCYRCILSWFSASGSPFGISLSE